jgi:phthalate 4,5-cis-dihydrodiol dehydrogenase
MISALNYTDFLYRPRRADELNTSKGGGVIYNQAPHHVDVVRFLGGGLVRSVYATAGAWDTARPTEGAYSAILKFDGGVSATITYSGYAHFDSDELMEWIDEGGHQKSQDGYGTARRLIREFSSANGELALKNARIYGGEGSVITSKLPQAHQHFGLIVVSCDHADLRPIPQGVIIYGDDERRLEPGTMCCSSTST